jgi:hypothetical protein
MKIEAWIDGIGIFAPGLVGWSQAVPVLAGRAPYVAAELPKLAPALLAPDVRRRTTDHIRLAVEVGGEAVRHAQADGSQLWSVFASSDGDGLIMNHICEEVAKEKPEVSPTRFHNSVNNAPAGYWCMAVQSRMPSTSLAAHDASFSAGLLEALMQVQVEQTGVLLISHDTPLPEPLHAVRPIESVAGVGLVLAPARSARSLARLSIAIEPALVPPSRMHITALDGLRTGNPTARSLPLLAAVARRATEAVMLPYVHSQSLRVDVAPA